VTGGLAVAIPSAVDIESVVWLTHAADFTRDQAIELMRCSVWALLHQALDGGTFGQADHHFRGWGYPFNRRIAGQRSSTAGSLKVGPGSADCRAPAAPRAVLSRAVWWR